MEANILALHFFFHPADWHYGIPLFAKDEVEIESNPSYIVYSIRFLFLGITLTL